MTRDANEGVVVVTGNDEKTSLIEIIVKLILWQRMTILLIVKELGDINTIVLQYAKKY